MAYVTFIASSTLYDCHMELAQPHVNIVLLLLFKLVIYSD